MKSEENRKKVIDVMEDSVISDKLNSYVVGFTKLGLLEMTRKKSGRTISEIMHVKCDSCFEGITQNRKVIVNQLLKDAYYRTKNSPADAIIYRVDVVTMNYIKTRLKLSLDAFSAQISTNLIINEDPGIKCGFKLEYKGKI